jgi:hypothetical protein
LGVIIFFVKKGSRWWFWIILLVLSFLSISKAWLGHYFILLIPFAGLIIVRLVGYLFQAMRLTSTIPKYTVVGFGIFMAFYMALPLEIQFFVKPSEFNRWLYRDDPFQESPVVAKRLIELTNPQDYVFVAGSEPEILYYSKRKNSTRFIISYPLVINTPFREAFQEEVINDVIRTEPKVIIYSPVKNGWSYFDYKPDNFLMFLGDVLSKEYSLVGGFVWKDGVGAWEEPLNENHVQNASLLLYKKV